MNSKAVISLISLLSVCMWTTHGQAIAPQLAPPNLLAQTTSGTVLLQPPNCVFTQTCVGCSIWLVASLTSATGTVGTLVNLSTPINLTVSPYPLAFTPGGLQFFLTPVGPLANFPCNPTTTPPYFIVGANGLCTGVNCNGVLPVGATVSFMYLLIDANNTLINMTSWSVPVTLVQLQNYQTINDGLSARSGAMVVITTLLCVAAALLLLLFFIMLCVTCCGKKNGRPVTVKNSIRIPRYDTHNLKDQVHPYDNPAYERDAKNYSSSETLPKSGIQTKKL